MNVGAPAAPPIPTAPPVTVGNGALPPAPAPPFAETAPTSAGALAPPPVPHAGDAPVSTKARIECVARPLRRMVARSVRENSSDHPHDQVSGRTKSNKPRRRPTNDWGGQGKASV